MAGEIPLQNPIEVSTGGNLVPISEAPITREQYKTFFPQEIPSTTPIKESYAIPSKPIFEHGTPISKLSILDENIFFTDTQGRFYYLDRDYQPHIINENKNGNYTHTFNIDHHTKEIFSAEGFTLFTRRLKNNNIFQIIKPTKITPPNPTNHDWGWGHISAIELTPEKIYFLLSLRNRILSLHRSNKTIELVSTDPNLLESNSLTIFPDGKAVIGGLGSKSSITDSTRPMTQEEITEDEERANPPVKEGELKPVKKERNGRKPDTFFEGVFSSTVLQKLSTGIIINGNQQGYIHRWSIDEPSKPILVGQQNGSITGILASPKSETTNERIISTDNEGEIYLWQSVNEKYQGTLIAKLEEPIRGIRIKPDGTIICAAGNKILLLN